MSAADFPRPCPECKGDGEAEYVQYRTVRCPACNGTGKVLCHGCEPDGAVATVVDPDHPGDGLCLDCARHFGVVEAA